MVIVILIKGWLLEVEVIVLEMFFIFVFKLLGIGEVFL